MSRPQPDTPAIPPPAAMDDGEPLRLADVVKASAVITVAALGVAAAFAFAAAGAYVGEKLGRIRKKGGQDVP